MKEKKKMFPQNTDKTWKTRGIKRENNIQLLYFQEIILNGVKLTRQPVAKKENTFCFGYSVRYYVCFITCTAWFKVFVYTMYINFSLDNGQ